MYQAEISRSNPACIVFLIDQSGSMSAQIGGGNGQKSQLVADAVNRLLQELAIKCSKGEEVRDYFDVAVIGYGRSSGPQSAFVGGLAGRQLVPISDIADNPARVEERMKSVPDGAGGLIEAKIRFPVWFDPVAGGSTPMVAPLGLAHKLVSDWAAMHPGSYPPIVLNITDGAATDGDPVPAALSMQQVATTDGQTLVFNLHVSSSRGTPVQFPSNPDQLVDSYARQLFEMSSVLPLHVAAAAAEEHNIPVGSDTRGFIFDADPTAIVQFLDIGTRVRRLLELEPGQADLMP